MLRICNLLDPRSVEANLSATGKSEVIREMVTVLARSAVVPEADRLVKELLDREATASTGVGGGIALPHRLYRGFAGTAIALGRKPGGLPFDAADGVPVSLFFLIVGPEGHHSEHLALLSRLARLLRDESLPRDMLAALDGVGMLAALRLRDAE